MTKIVKKELQNGRIQRDYQKTSDSHKNADLKAHAKNG